MPFTRAVAVTAAVLTLSPLRAAAADEDAPAPDLDLTQPTAVDRETVSRSHRFSGLDAPSPRENLWVSWELRKDLLEKGEADLADRKLEELLELRLDLGLRNVSKLSFALLEEAWDAADAGDAGLARELARTAEIISPDRPEPNFALARLYAKGSFEPAGMLGEALKGIRKALSHPLELHRLLGETLLRLAVAFLLALLLFVATQWVRYGAMLRHDLLDILPKGIGRWQGTAIVAMLAITPVVLGLGLLPVVVIWIAALFGYQRFGERLVSLVAVVFLSSLPLTLGAMDRFLDQHGTVTEALYLANYDFPGASAIATLVAAEARAPRDADVIQALGLLDKQEGRLYKAEERLKAAFEASGRRSAQALVLLGNVYVADNRLSDAAEQYDKAAGVEPSLAAVHFNRSKLYSAQGKSEAEAAAEAAKALRQDEARVERFQHNQKMGLNRYLLDERVETGSLFARLLKHAEGPATLVPFAWPKLAGSLAADRAPMLGGIVVAFLVVFWTLRRRMRFASHCIRCGDAVCVRCFPGIGRTSHCAACYHVFHRAERVQPRERQRQERLVRRHRSRKSVVSTALTFVFTGTGHLLLGRALRGIAFLTVFFLFVGVVFAWDGLLRPVSPSFPGLSLGRVGVAALVFGVVYLLAILDIRVEERVP